jgi:hypothetical protein
MKACNGIDLPLPLPLPFVAEIYGQCIWLVRAARKEGKNLKREAIYYSETWISPYNTAQCHNV